MAKQKIQKKLLPAYSKLSITGKIGIEPPVKEEEESIGPCLDLKLKPPKISHKSKKIYKDIFIRSLNKQSEHHLYTLEGLYICSIYKSLDDTKKWIDERYEDIKERVCRISIIQ